MNDVGIMLPPEVRETVKFGPTATHEMTVAGLFPPAFQIGGRRVARLSVEVHAWLAARAKELTDEELRRFVAEMVRRRPDATYADLRALINEILAERPQTAPAVDAVARRRPAAALAARAARSI